MSLVDARLNFRPTLPKVLQHLDGVDLKRGQPTGAEGDVAHLFPHTFGQPKVHLEPGSPVIAPRVLKVGVVLSGGQAPGGHNVIAGLFDALKGHHKDSVLYGFIDGPGGIVDAKRMELTGEIVDRYRNLGGFDMIGAGRTKIESDEQLQASLRTCERLQLDGLVVIGGDDSNTNAALLAEYFISAGCTTKVVGVPKTIDGDLKNEQIEISFGHDTACKVYAELVGNLMRDAMSARKYWHFVRLMGRSASHITLECALQTRPNVTLIGEEVAAKGSTLAQIADQIAEVVKKRAEGGKKYGVVLVPEGLIEFIPEVGQLIRELNALLAKGDEFLDALTGPSRACWESLPADIQKQLLLDRDPHGNVQVSRIETERLLIEMVQQRVKFSGLAHFFGYEGRSAMPSNFDCNYCYALGYMAAVLVQHGLTGYMSTIHKLNRPAEEWTAGGTPTTMMFRLEERLGKSKPVIAKALVDLDGAPFKALVAGRDEWAVEDCFGYPGPIQFAGCAEITESIPQTLALELS